MDTLRTHGFRRPGVDNEHDGYPADGRFPSPGEDTRFGGDAPPPVDQDKYVFIVRPGTVTQDLTEFPVKVDLSLAPDAWWTYLTRDDGGDIRVSTDTGVPLPTHVIKFDRAAKTGVLVAKTTIRAASETHIVCSAMNDPDMEPIAPDAPMGQYAAWSAYFDVRLLNGDLTDATGTNPDLTWVSAGPNYITNNTMHGAGGGVDSTAAAGYGHCLTDGVALDDADFTQFVLFKKQFETTTNQTMLGTVNVVGSSTERRLLGEHNSTNVYSDYSTAVAGQWLDTDVPSNVLGVLHSLSKRSDTTGIRLFVDGTFNASSSGVAQGKRNIIVASGRGGSDGDFRGELYMALTSIGGTKSDDWMFAEALNWFYPDGLRTVPLPNTPIVGVAT